MYDGYIQLHVPFPSELSDPSLCGSNAAVEEILITLAGLTLVEPFARRSERLKRYYVLPSMYFLDPPIINSPTQQSLKNGEISDPKKRKKKKKKKWRTVKDAFNIDVKYVIPSFLLWKIVEWASPGDTRVVHEDMDIVFPFTEFSNESIAPCF